MVPVLLPGVVRRILATLAWTAMDAVWENTAEVEVPGVAGPDDPLTNRAAKKKISGA